MSNTIVAHSKAATIQHRGFYVVVLRNFEEKGSKLVKGQL